MDTTRRLDSLLRQETIELLKCAEKIAEMNETFLGMVQTNNPIILESLRDSTTLLSQVLQSIEDRQNEEQPRVDVEEWR